MNDSRGHDRLIIPGESLIYEQLHHLAGQQRLVFFAGLPGTGKSLLIHQLAHLAAAYARKIHLLQWDVVRPVFEAHPAGQPYPMTDGVTHGVIRKAIGLWVRHAVTRWHQTYAAFDHLLIGETPFIGNRFIELARLQSDPAETILRDVTCVFVIPVPSVDVRRHVETERQRRNRNPAHEQETEDAPPQVLQALWQELARTAPCIGVETRSQQVPVPYDPLLYQQVYEVLLRHRHMQIMAIDIRLPTATLSVYDFAVERSSLIPSADDVVQFIHAVERRYPDEAALQRDIEQWYIV